MFLRTLTRLCGGTFLRIALTFIFSRINETASWPGQAKKDWLTFEPVSTSRTSDQSCYVSQWGEYTL